MKTLMIYSKLVRYFLLIAVVTFTACDFSSSYGLEKIAQTDDGSVYVKWVSRGFSYEAVVVSINKNYCAEPDKSTEYVFTDNGTKKYIVKDNILFLFITLPPDKLVTKIPQKGEFPITVKLLDIGSEESKKILQSDTDFVKTLTIPMDKSLKCWF